MRSFQRHRQIICHTQRPCMLTNLIYIIILLYTLNPCSYLPIDQLLIVSLSMHLVVLSDHPVHQSCPTMGNRATYRPICLKYHSRPVFSDMAKNGPCLPSRVYKAMPLLSSDSDPSSENETCHITRSFFSCTSKMPLSDRMDTASSPGISGISHHFVLTEVNSPRCAT